MRNEYPRPDFIREKWMPLNGTWNFQDGTDKTPVKIQVPFPPQSRLSGFQKELTSDRITYQRNFLSRQSGSVREFFFTSELLTTNAAYLSTIIVSAFMKAVSPLSPLISQIFFPEVKKHSPWQLPITCMMKPFPEANSSGNHPASLSGTRSPAASGSPYGWSR